MIGVVGSEGTDRLVAVAEREGGAARHDDAGSLGTDTVDAVVAVGEDALVDVVRAGLVVPVLPVDAGPGTHAVSLETAVDLVDDLVTGAYETRRQPTIEVERTGESPCRALFDAMLATSEPVRISEFGVVAEDTEERVRADGVVLATPAGSHGYARSVGTPALETGRDVVAVAPVGAFTMDPPSWVFDLGEPLDVSVTREDGDVTLFLDGRSAGRVEDAVAVRRGEPLATVVPEE